MKNLITIILFVVGTILFYSKNQVEIEKPDEVINEFNQGRVDDILQNPEEWKLMYFKYDTSFAFIPEHEDSFRSAIVISYDDEGKESASWSPFSVYWKEADFTSKQAEILYDISRKKIESVEAGDWDSYVFPKEKIYFRSIVPKPKTIPLYN